MTALIHSHSQPFDAERIAPFTARKMGISTQEVLDQWAFTNALSKVKGTHIHAYNEYMWQGKSYMYPVDEVVKQFGTDVLEDLWEPLKKISNKFYEDYKDKIIPIGLELVIGDEDLSIGGSIDFLGYLVEEERLVIIDYKSNKQINLRSYYDKRKQTYQMMTGCLSHLEDCNYNHYSLQLNGYQHILQKHTHLKLRNTHYLIWINEKNSDYEIFETRDLYDDAVTMLYEGKDDVCPF